MFAWFGQRRLRKAFCIIVPACVLLTGCNTGFNAGMVAGGRCIWTPYAPGSPNYFSYTPDCPGRNTGSVGYGPDHWTYVAFKMGAPDNSALQQAPIGLLDSTTNPPTAINPNSKWQSTWLRDPAGPGYVVDMNLKPGIVNQYGDHVDFDLANMATDGIPGLHSHHEIAMNSRSGTCQVGYVLWFTVGNEHYMLLYALPPRNTDAAKANGVIFNTDTTDDDGPYHHVGIDASRSYPGLPAVPNIHDNGYVSIDIDWAALVQYVKGQGLFPNLDVNQTKREHTWIQESYYSSVYGPRGTALGGVETLQKNWVMDYR